jgi:hypothetical protein
VKVEVVPVSLLKRETGSLALVATRGDFEMLLR